MKLFDQIYPICSMQPSTSRPTITRATIGADNLHKPTFAVKELVGATSGMASSGTI